MRKLVAFAALCLVLGAGTALHVRSMWNSKQILEKTHTLTVPKGATAAQIADSLVAKGLLSHPQYFTSYMRWEKLTPMLRAGTFYLRDTVSIVRIAAILTKPEEGSAKITIPEGRAHWEILQILQRKMPWLDEKEWERLATDSIWLAHLGISGKSIEGYLFPATYQFPQGADEAALQEIMVKQFHKVWKSLDTSNSSNLAKYGAYGVLTLASIVEEESALAQERGDIAGVFSRRLEQNISLGADPTVRYTFRNVDKPLLKSQLESDSPYNTRRFKGLPPGPISNPGKEALLAALRPKSGTSLFFVAKDDGSRAHYFAKTYQDHLAYCDSASRNRQAAGRSATAEY